MDKKTPLYERHVAWKGKIVPFGGFLMPVQYEAGIIAEHMAVREKAGLFDVSHMGEVIFEGPGALATLNHLLTNDYTNLAVGRVRYGVMCQEDGGCLDDLIVYRMGEEKYLVVVNASNHDKDVAHMKQHLLPETTFTDISEETGLLALQGPASKEIAAKILEAGELPTQYYSFREHVVICGVECIASRTGYTGEYGYEIFCPADKAPVLWEAILEAGKDAGILPCGLGARDTLRLEAAMPLYGHEMDETVSPLETGLDFGVKMGKEDFIGKAGIEARGLSRERIGLRVTGRGIVREHADVYKDGALIGHTTSGTFCPYLKGSYAMALVSKGAAPIGAAVEAEVRGKRVSCEVVELPFYKRGN